MNPRSRRAAGNVLRVAAALILPFLSWQLFTRAWTFPEPLPFRGPSLYNPYSGVAFAPGRFTMANFHAHTRAWGGLTDGRKVSSEELRKGYARLGYGVAAVSDYMRIRPAGEGPGAWIPAYEHGYGLTKSHQLCLGATRVDWLDFPIFQTIHHKQTVLDRLRRSSRAVALVHPQHWSSYSLEDFRFLTGYRLLEVASVHPRDATPFWDAALSAGHPVFAVADDDSRGLGDDAGVSATFVDAPATDGEAIVAALLAGKAYGAKASHQKGESLEARGARLRELPRLSAFSVDGETVRVSLSSPAAAIRFIGQGGRELEKVVDATEAAYRLVPGDTYVRTEIDLAGEARLYLNPVFRTSGTEPLRDREARERPAWSALLRVSAVLPWIVLAGLLLRARRTRGSSPAPVRVAAEPRCD